MEKVLAEPAMAPFVVQVLWWICAMLGAALLWFVKRLIDSIDANTVSNAHLVGAVDGMRLELNHTRTEVDSTRREVESLRGLEPRVHALEIAASKRRWNERMELEEN